MKNNSIFLCALSMVISFVSLGQETATPGSDRDKHGCIGSAGYTYSEIKKTCIRVFEQEIQLSEVNPGSTSSIAAVIFSSDNKKAEVFLPTYPSGQILVRSGTKGNYVWKKGDMVLTNKKAYELRKANKLIFQGEIK